MPTTLVVHLPSETRVRQVSLWVVQVFLAMFFFISGFSKLTMPISGLTQVMAWTASVPLEFVRVIGALEIAGALGLVLPSLLKIRPILTPLAALALTALMFLAFGFHLMRSEGPNLPVNAALGALAFFVAWGRYRRVPISPMALPYD